MAQPFRNNHKSDAAAIGVTGGAGSAPFIRRVLVGRARQAIWLKKIHQYVAVSPTTPGHGAGDTLQGIVINQASPTVSAPTGTTPNSSIVNLFDQFAGALAGYRNRQGIIDAHRLVQAQDIGANGTIRSNNVYEWTEQYDLLVPGVYVYYGFLAVSFTANMEIFTHVEFEWVGVSLAEMAALQFNWGLDPVDFDQENL